MKEWLFRARIVIDLCCLVMASWAISAGRSRIMVVPFIVFLLLDLVSAVINRAAEKKGNAKFSFIVAICTAVVNLVSIGLILYVLLRA